jgi:hypothetical protein
MTHNPAIHGSWESGLVADVLEVDLVLVVLVLVVSNPWLLV